MEVHLALNGAEELMDLPLEAGLEPPSWSPSETHSPNSEILEELHPWDGEVKVCMFENICVRKLYVENGQQYNVLTWCLSLKMFTVLVW